ncbi:MAG: FkbM family methyltransferase [Gaiellaceae bacterium]
MPAGETRSITRALARHYPFMPFRGRVPLLRGSVDQIPDGRVVDTREGLRIRVARDGMYKDVYFWGDYAPYHTKIYKRIVRPGDVVFDVGANFGWFTALFARWVGEHGRVHAFEPVRFIHELAVETLALNGVGSHVHLNQLALGREQGSLAIHTFEGLPHGHATASDLGRTDTVRHRCEVRRLDQYCMDNGVDTIRFMKVDVEGFEPDVFAGAERMLTARDAPVIAFEVNGECLRARGLASVDVIDPLREFGYSHFYRFSTRMGVRPFQSVDFSDGDCLAAKTSQIGALTSALRASRLFR